MTHDWNALRAVAATERSPAAIGALTPWMCDYRRPDGLYTIVLHGSDPQQVWTDNVEGLPGLRIIGIFWGKVGGEGEEA